MALKSEKPHLVLFGWKDSYIEFVHELGIRVTLVQYPFMISNKLREGDYKLIEVPLGEEHLAEPIIRELHEKDPITAMASFYPTWLVLVSKLGEELNVRCNSVEAVEKTRFKDKFREVLMDSKKAQIKWENGFNALDVEKFFNTINNDIIVKPIAGGGSAGVFKMTDASEAKFAFEQARNVPFWANMENHEGILMEEFIEGNEYSIETLSYDGEHKVLSIVEKVTTGAPNFIEIAHLTPANLTDVQRQNIEGTVLEMLRLIGQTNGPCHTEVKLRGDTPYIIETQTRFGGDQIWELVWLTTGYHAGVETVAHLCNVSHDRKAPKTKAACVYHFVPEEADITILEIEGVTLAKESEGVLKLSVKDVSQDNALTVKHSGDRLGFVLTTGESRDEALSRCLDAINKIKLKTDSGYSKLKIN